MARMDERPQTEAVTNVRIDIGCDVEPFIARLLDESQGSLHQWPILLSRGFEMVNVNGDVGFPAYADDLLYRIEKMRAFIAHVREIGAAILSGHFGELDELFRLRISAWRIDESSRESDRPVLHRLS